MRRFFYYTIVFLAGIVLTVACYESRPGPKGEEVLVTYPTHTGTHPGAGEYTVFRTVRLVPRRGDRGAGWTISDSTGDRRYQEAPPD